MGEKDISDYDPVGRIFNLRDDFDDIVKDNEKIIGRIASDIEIQAESDYYIKFDSENLLLEEKNVSSYTSNLSDKIKNAISNARESISDSFNDTQASQTVKRQKLDMLNSELAIYLRARACKTGSDSASAELIAGKYNPSIPRV